MSDLPTPPVPDLARAKGETVAQLEDWFIRFYNEGGAPFNYRRGTLSVRAAYRGLHRLGPLTAACEAEKTKIGRISNLEVVTNAAPFAFGRSTQVFDLPRRKFPFGRERAAAFRIPFLFVENGKIYVYHLQPRKGAGLTFDELSMVATIIKTYLIDTEFYGQACDVEFVDVGVPVGAKQRVPRRYSLGELMLWSPKRLADRLTLLSEALDRATNSGRIVERRRRPFSSVSDMPLF
jgi:hypothetical protein